MVIDVNLASVFRATGKPVFPKTKYALVAYAVVSLVCYGAVDALLPWVQTYLGFIGLVAYASGRGMSLLACYYAAVFVVSISTAVYLAWGSRVRVDVEMLPSKPYRDALFWWGVVGRLGWLTVLALTAGALLTYFLLLNPLGELTPYVPFSSSRWFFVNVFLEMTTGNGAMYSYGLLIYLSYTFIVFWVLRMLSMWWTLLLYAWGRLLH